MKRKTFTLAGCVLILLINACKKNTSEITATTKNISSSSSIPKGYTMTSIGLLPDSNITVIEKGYKLSFLNGHAYKVHIASGKIIKDFGKVNTNLVNGSVGYNSPMSHGKNLNTSTAGLAFGNSGQTSPWVTYAQWQNTTANPITNFTTDFTVPNTPTSSGNQAFAIWMGLEPAYNGFPIIQPLLIWGNAGGAIGGGQYWTIVSYIIWPITNSQGQTQ